MGNTSTITTVNPKGQVTIPEPLRSKYGFPPGTRVIWIERDGDLVPRPVLATARLQSYLRAERGQRSLTAALLTQREAERHREDS